MDPASQDPSRHLTEDGRWTEPWGGSDDGRPCDKCRGRSQTGYTCWSCVLTGARSNCPVCQGKVRWPDRCPVCRGTGEVDGRPRHGVSVFPAVEGLYHYILRKDTDVEDSVVVELEAEPADDVDFDADQGAMLMVPRAILARDPADPEIAGRRSGAQRRTLRHPRRPPSVSRSP